MAEGGDSPVSSSSPRNLSFCNECGLNPWKYRCPGCSIRSCSLPCVNSHKKRTGCTGKRNRAEFVPLSQFDDKILLSDYTFLEETKRFAESARRVISDFHGRFKLPYKLRLLKNAAKWRRVCLLFFLPGMSKRESNQSMYDARKNSIFWTIELKFHGTDVVIIHHGVDEHASLWSILEKHLAPSPWNHKLRSFCDVPPDDLNLFIQKNPKGSKSVLRKLDINLSLRSQLGNVLILEYPVIFAYLPSHAHDFQVETIRKPLARKTPPPSSNDMQCHKEEGDLPSDRIVTGQMDCGKSKASSVDAPGEKTRKEDNGADFTDEHVQKETAGDHCHLNGEVRTILAPNSPQVSEEGGFCFEQELTDAYSDLIGEMNPDDFLCLDSGFSDSWCFMEEGKSNVSEERRHTDMNEREGEHLEARCLDGVEEGRDDSILPSCGEVELEEGEIPYS